MGQNKRTFKKTDTILNMKTRGTLLIDEFVGSQ